MKAYFQPQPKRFELKKFGLDVTIDTTSIVFTRASLLLNPEVGERLILPGDVIIIPYNHIDEIKEPLRMRVNNVTPHGMYHYRWIYMKADCEPITGDDLVGPKNDF
jgi:hypothetical protein